MKVRYLLLDEIYMYSNYIGKVSTSDLRATRMEVGRTMLLIQPLIQPLETLSLPNFSFNTQIQNGNRRRNGAEFLNSSHEPTSQHSLYQETILSQLSFRRDLRENRLV